MNVIDFSTELALGEDPVSKWKKVTGQSGLTSLDRSQRASLRGVDLHSVKFSSLQTGGYILESDGEASDESELSEIKFIFQQEGECTVEQADGTVLLMPGNWCMFDRAKPYQLSSRSTTRQITLVLKHNYFGKSAQTARSGFLRRQSAVQGAARILHDSIQSSLDELGRLSRANLMIIGQVVADLAGLAVRDASEEQGGACNDVARMRILQFIEEKIDDPHLSIDQIAKALHCSKRYLHKVFACSDTTVAKYIWTRRVEHCRVELTDPARSNRTITDIAYRWGFNDSHHFSRLFRQRYGLSPRDYRAATR